VATLASFPAIMQRSEARRLEGLPRGLAGRCQRPRVPGARGRESRWRALKPTSGSQSFTGGRRRLWRRPDSQCRRRVDR